MTNDLTLRRRLNRLLNPHIGTTAANITVHSRFNVFIGRVGIGVQQGSGVHDLPGLAVAALGDVVFEPGFLHGVIAVSGQSLDGSDFLIPYLRNGQHAGTHGDAVKMDSAGTALSDAAAVFGADQVEVIS